MSVADRIAALTPEQRALFDLLRQKQRKATQSQQPPPIPRVSGPAGAGDWPLTFDQERLWFLHVLDPGSAAYNMISAARLRGRLAAAALAQALTEVVRRQGAWRTTFPTVAGGAVQRVAAEPDVKLPVVDLTALPLERREPVALALVDAEGKRPFSLERGPLVRAVLLRLAEREHICLLTVHHIVNDWVSFQIFWRDLALSYGALSAGELVRLPEPSIQYADFAAWQRGWLSGEVLQGYLDWWREQLVGFPLFLDLPSDRPRAADRLPRGGRLAVRIDRELTAGLRALAQREGATRFMVLMALSAALLSRLSGQERLIVGTLNAGRNRPEIESLFGFFLTQLPFATDLSGDPPFRELVGRVRKVALGAYAHQELPFGKLVEALQPERDLSRMPIVQALVQLIDAQGTDAQLGDLELETIDIYDGNARYDLMLALYERQDSIVGPLEYNADAFDATTAGRMLELLYAMAAAAVADPDVRLSELPAFTEAACQQVLVEWNDTFLSAAGPPTVVHLFAEQAARTPEATAWAGDGWRLSYAELDERSNRLARYLRRLGVGPEDLVGIFLERQAELPVALLGVLKSGAGYLPLELAHPADRRAFMLSDAQAVAVLTQDRLVSELPRTRARTVRLDADRREIERESAEPLAPVAAPEHRAYVIYTSGSTGLPKGVEIPHRALANFVRAIRRLYTVEAGDAMPAITTIAFDLSVPELYLPMLGGGTTPLLARETAADGALLAQALDAWEATVLQASPATYRQLLEAGWLGRRELLLLCGAEALGRDLADRLLPLGRGLWNFYGPTETTVWSTAWPVAEEGAVSIGRPIANTRIFLLDSRSAPVPFGAVGEVAIGGEGLARGYHRRPGLTAAKFVPDPLSGVPGARLYRTGDLARYRNDGLLEYRGRADHQVKLRGFRVEPGEVEAGLRRHPRISEAVVVLREDRPGDARLAAYVAVGDAEPPTPAELRNFLKESLPDYMVPSALVVLPALPRNANGKIDRHALPAPETTAVAAFSASPCGLTEELIAAIWCEILGLPRVGRSDDFFELGGHSLLATQLVVRLQEATGVALPVREVFQSPTVAGLAAAVEVRQGDEHASTRPPLVPVPRQGDLPLSFAQERLWFIDQLAPGTPAYNVAGAFRLAGALPPSRLAAAFAGVVARHEALRTTFPDHAGRPAQSIAPSPTDWHLSVVDLSGLAEISRQGEVARLASEEALASFDLARGPLLRTRLLRLAADEHVLLLNVHHIVSDAWSLGILVGDVAALAGGEQLPELPIQYADYASWQRRWLQAEELERQLGFWRESLAGAPAVLELPTDRPRPLNQSFRGGSVDLDLEPGLSRQMMSFSRRQGATPFMTVLAAWGVVLSRLSGQPDLVVGAAIANRDRPELERLIGLFVNTLPMRVDGRDDPPFSELLSRVRRASLEAFSHRDVPLERLIEGLQVARDRSRQPLVQALLTFINTPLGKAEVPGLAAAPLVTASETAKFDLTLAAFEEDGRFRFRLEYAVDLFEPATAARWMGHFATLIAGLVQEPEGRVFELPLLAEAERRQILVEWNRTAAVTMGPEDLIHDRFWRQAARTPQAVALIWGQAKWTYADLAARADRLARRLRRHGIGPEVRVGVSTRRSPEMVVAVLAVLRAGGAYVPLDPSYPAERLAFLVADAAAPLVLTQADLGAPPLAGVQAILLDMERDEPGPAGSDEEPAAAPMPDNLAYLIYTSGSTGEPKGVMIRHGSAAALVAWALRAFTAEELAGVLASTSLSFDLSIFELFVPLAAGGAVVLADDILRLPSLPAAGAVTLINTVPSALTGMLRLAALPTSVITVNLAGEPLPAALVEKLRREPGVRRVLNLYGPSEDTTYSTWSEVASGAGKPLIGRPVDGSRVYLLDASLQPVPPGVPGEIYLGGAGLARGYLHRPDLTAERFVPDPFAEFAAEPGARLYRTADLGRFRPDGEIDFLGRTDFQVKVRGFRIELGEIEAVIARHPDVRACAVVVRRDARGDSRLVAYVVPGAGEPPLARDLRRWCRSRLPDHMTPSALVPLEALPVTSHGKLDRDALPDPVWGGEAEAAYVPPATPVEEKLVRLCAEVLGIPAECVGMRDNFFALGGHSLLATQLLARLREEYGIDVPLEAVFDTADLRELADSIVEQELGGTDDELLAEVLEEIEGVSPAELRSMLGHPADLEGAG